jgi:hypothetical protein
LEQPDDNPWPWLVFEPAITATPPAAVDLPEHAPVSDEITTTDQKDLAPIWTEDTGIQIIRATRSWIQYGTVGFAVICIVIGAVEGLFGR